MTPTLASRRRADMTISINGRVGVILLAILGIVVGLGLVFSFALPSVLIGVWLIIGCLLWLIGT